MKKPIKEQKSVLIILLSNLFIAFLGMGLIIPVMPSFMEIMHLSGKTMGYLVAGFRRGAIDYVSICRPLGGPIRQKETHYSRFVSFRCF